MTPEHYQTEVSPWDLQEHMPSSGNAFVDGRRCDAIKYIFRDKESLLEDLKKAKHCLEAAIERLTTKSLVEKAPESKPTRFALAYRCGHCKREFMLSSSHDACPRCHTDIPPLRQK